MKPQEMLEKFKKDICINSEEIDPTSEHDWYDLSYGFFLGLGANIEEAEELALEARYTHKYWC